MRNIKFFSFINIVACKAGVFGSALVLARPSSLSFPVAFMNAAAVNVPTVALWLKKKRLLYRLLIEQNIYCPHCFITHCTYLRLIGSLVLRW